jgi:sugar phosphate isomerase/epimerase
MSAAVPTTANPPLRKALSTIGCPELTLPESFALAARHGLEAVELRALEGNVDLPTYFTRTYGTPEALARARRGQSVRVAALDTSYKLVGATAAARDQLVAHVRWAEALGVSWLRVFDGGSPGDAAALNEAAATLRAWRALRRAHGWSVDLMVETHDALVNGPALARFLELVPDAALLWDTHHTWRKGGEDPVALWPQLRAHTVHLHVRDSIAAPHAQPPFHYTLPGTGEFPMAPLLAALRTDRYPGMLCLEWERLWIPELPDLEQVLGAAASNQWW